MQSTLSSTWVVLSSAQQVQHKIKQVVIGEGDAVWEGDQIWLLQYVLV
jgi:hypothetical protein